MAESEENTTSQVGADMSVEYANNVVFEQTVWDIKLLFGEWTSRTSSVDWHSSITIPWAQAKLMAYYLQVNIALQEAHHGHIRVPAEMTPQDFQFPEIANNDPTLAALHQKLRALREAFIASMSPPATN